MKTLICIFILLFVFFESSGQRYELWVRTFESKYNIRGNYGFSNDSILMIYSNASILFPSKETHFKWDDVTDIKLRNKSRNQVGQLIGTGAGLLALGLINNSVKNETGEGLGMYMIVVAPAVILSGTLIGHLTTKKKKNINLQDVNPKEKDKEIKKAMSKKKNTINQ